MLHGRILRWMYRGGRPNRLAAAMNRVQAVAARHGLGPERVVTVEVVGRRTGHVAEFPLVVVAQGRERYLVAMLGREANWVRNVHAARGHAVILRGGREEVRLVDVDDPAERAPILRRYLELAPGGRPHIPVDRDAPLAAFEAIAGDYPVFRVTPAHPR